MLYFHGGNHKGFPCSSIGKESACSAGDPGWIPGLGRSPGGGNGNHSSILAWKISWTGEPGGLQSMGSQRVGHDYHAHLLSPYGSQTALNVFNTSCRWNSDLNILNASLK